MGHRFLSVDISEQFRVKEKKKIKPKKWVATPNQLTHADKLTKAVLESLRCGQFIRFKARGYSEGWCGRRVDRLIHERIDEKFLAAYYSRVAEVMLLDKNSGSKSKVAKPGYAQCLLPGSEKFGLSWMLVQSLKCTLQRKYRISSTKTRAKFFPDLHKYGSIELTSFPLPDEQRPKILRSTQPFRWWLCACQQGGCATVRSFHELRSTKEGVKRIDSPAESNRGNPYIVKAPATVTPRSAEDYVLRAAASQVGGMRFITLMKRMDSTKIPHILRENELCSEESLRELVERMKDEGKLRLDKLESQPNRPKVVATNYGKRILELITDKIAS